MNSIYKDQFRKNACFVLSCEKGYRGAVALSNIGRGGVVRYGGGLQFQFLNMKVVGHYDQRWRAIWQLFGV